ncbi:hypothetical protein [Mucilaginibacter humi]|nr:hypothetical protein [Mucilaginibacter humi]
MKEEYINPKNGLKVVGYTIINGGHTGRVDGNTCQSLLSEKLLIT